MFLFVPFPVVTWSKLQIHNRSLAGFAVSIPARASTSVCWLLFVVS